MVFALHSRLKACSDSEVMARVGKGDERAFAELYRRYARSLQGFFCRMLWGDEELAADFLQDLFLRVWTARSSYNGKETVRAWLFTMAYNLCRNEYRHREVQDNYVWQVQPEDFVQVDQPELQMDASAFDRALAEVLAGLPREPRLLFALRYEEELTLEEIAGLLQLPVGTVKSRCHYLLSYLKKELKVYENV